MLALKNIVKDYYVGNDKVEALKGVTILFRKSEFVSILGPSGCGKTTLLNIVGGLDRYTSGDLVINGKSTKEFKDRDWDSYRNHTIGFVFQSYNLIPHQTVLQNVELALTLTGVSKDERRKRAIEALKKVGLGDKLKNKPSQMSGGQMQRVAIARALVNNPDILLADEPTGALDSVTSVQIMDILKEISKDKLIIMVTHNKELAETYSSRIITAKDGLIINDSMPYTEEEQARDQKVIDEENQKLLKLEEEKFLKAHPDKVYKAKKKKKPHMNFFTALSLSLKNLMTKKGRTILTSFAGSIGIIGIALILALSNGFQSYINTVQEDTLSSYPLAINKNQTDFNSFFQNMGGGSSQKHDLDKIYSNSNLTEMMNSFAQVTKQNNSLAGLKQHIESNYDEISEYVSALTYAYNVQLQVYSSVTENGVNKVNPSTIIDILIKAMGQEHNPFITPDMYNTFGEIIPGLNGEIVSPLIVNQYDVIHGTWPTNNNELVLIVNEKNEISDLTLYALGLKDQRDFLKFLEDAAKPGFKPELDTSLSSWTYEDICSQTYKLILPTDIYEFNSSTNKYENISNDETKMKIILQERGVELKISGIVRPKPETTVAALSGSIGYTSGLMKEYIEKINNSKIVKDQLANKEVNILTGEPFAKFDDKTPEAKLNTFKNYALSLKDPSQKIAFYKELFTMPTKAEVDYARAAQIVNIKKSEESIKLFKEQYIESVRKKMEDQNIDMEPYFEEVRKMNIDDLLEKIRPQMELAITDALKGMKLELIKDQSDSELLSSYDALINNLKVTDNKLNLYYDVYKTFRQSIEPNAASLKDVLLALGSVDPEDPQSIYFYPKSFEDKEVVENFIAEYNATCTKEDQLVYNDYIGTFMAGVSLIIDAISYVLIGFVAISLVVSSIMIGIITYISVLERTKEIGILRAIGASKKDVKRVFNAETLIVGFTAGMLGILVTLVLCIPLTLILQHLSGVKSLAVILPPVGGVILVLISMFLTFLSGLIPASFAAKKDPVDALRTE